MKDIDSKYCVPELVRELDVLPNSTVKLSINVTKCGRLQIIFSECKVVDEDVLIKI